MSNNNLIKPRLLKGFRDSLPKEESHRKELITTFETVFRRSGYLPIDTPALEYTEILLGKGGGETDKQVYSFHDHGNRNVSMRFDLTVPFARFMSLHKSELSLPFRRYHIGKVWRGENTQKGRYREFFQCDFDVVGSDSTSLDFEILLIINDTLKALNLNNFVVDINHRGIFNRFLSLLKVEEQQASLLRIVDKLPKIGEEEVCNQLEHLCPQGVAPKIINFIKREKSNDAVLEKFIDLVGSCSEVERLQTLLNFVKALDLEENVQLNPAITRGLDYYTGVVFETFLKGAEKIGSICSGGRYDNLTGLYMKEPLPGVGASIGLDRLIAALDFLGEGEAAVDSVDLMIFLLDEQYMAEYHKLAAKIRSHNLSCHIFPYAKKVSQQFKYCEENAIPFGLFCGEEEFSKNGFTLKNLKSRESWTLSTLEQVVETVTKRRRDEG